MATSNPDLLDAELAASRLNPNYRDVLYCEELIGRDTVNTAPQHGGG
jgi:hypothetical protein